MLKKSLSLLLSVIMLLSLTSMFTGCQSNGYDENCMNIDYNLTEDIQSGTILHCFSWDFDTITKSMEDIAAAGYSTIQTSPINECYVGEKGGMQLYGNGKWYYHFQPTDYTIGNYQLGTQEQFKLMCDKAEEYGIKVIVDVVPNHTSFTIDAVSDSLFDAVGGRDKLFHKNAKEDITDYGDRLSCTTKKMGGLPDINTENKAYQDYFIKFLNDCIECGADGFRYDCAKHIALPDDPTETKGVKNNFWTRVTTEIKDADRIFNYGEVLQGNNDRIRDYIETIGATTASSYGDSIRNAIIKENVDTAFVTDLRLGGSESCVTWVESHDNYINDGNWFAMNEEQVKLAYCIIAARKAGTPMFFNRPYGNSQSEQWGTMNRIGASGSYGYKAREVVAVNFFRNAMVGLDEEFINCDDESKSIQICRGDKGAVIVNLKDELEVNFETSLADGKYLDRVDNETVYTVKNGIITCNTPIKKNTVVVLYNENYTQYATPAIVKIDDGFNCLVDTNKIQVPLVAINAEESRYSINDGEKETFVDGDVIEIDIFDEDEGVATLTLTGISKAGQQTYMKYYFTNTSYSTVVTEKVNKGDKVYFEKPDAWGDKIYSYVYSQVGGSQNSSWPGIEMTKNGDKYEYTFSEDWADGLIMFNDGENQYPGANEQGLVIEKDKTYTVE